MALNEQQVMIRDTLQRLLSDMCPPDVVDAAEQGEFPAALWQTLAETGLTLAGISEAAGGSGGDLEDSLLVIREAASFATPLPLAEHFMAASLLAEAGATCNAGPMTVALGDFALDAELTLTGNADQVAFARWAEEVILLARQDEGLKLCRVNTGDVELTPGVSMAGEPRDQVTINVKLDGEQVFEVAADMECKLQLMGAALRGLMMAGALESVLEMSVAYSMERTQFGRPISKFQAIQQQLATLAGEVAASTMAAHAITSAYADLTALDIAIGKARIGEAVSACTDIAHQVHGAMGYTLEHSLNHRTRRLWDWRSEYGAERHWQLLVGREFLAAGADNLWDGITRRV
jgi:acyl-CoA dehydrogenase